MLYEVITLELLHVLGRGATGAGLEEAAPREQRHNRQHTRARAQLQDREEVREVVAKHVTGDRYGVLAAADALQRERHRLDRRQDADIQPLGVLGIVV